MLQHLLVHQLPVRVVGGLAALPAPPDHVPGTENKLGPPALDIPHHLAGNPVAALQPEHRAAHARQQLDVLDRGLGDPALVHRQRGHFAGGHERHDHLHQLMGGRVVDELDILLDDLFRDFLRQAPART